MSSSTRSKSAKEIETIELIVEAPKSLIDNKELRDALNFGWSKKFIDSLNIIDKKTSKPTRFKDPTFAILNHVSELSALVEDIRRKRQIPPNPTPVSGRTQNEENEVRMLKERCNTLNHEKKQKDTEIQRLKSEHEKEISKLAEELSRKTEEFDGQTQRLREEIAKEKEANKKAAATTTPVISNTESDTKECKKCQSYEDRVKGLEKAITDHEAINKQLEHSLGILKSENTNLKVEIQKKEEDRVKLVKQLEETERDASNDNDQHSHDQVHADHEARPENLQGEIQKLEKNLKTLSGENVVLRGQLEAKQKEHAKLFTELEASKRNASSDKKSNDQRIEEQQTKNDEMQKTLSQLQNTLSQTKSELVEANSEIQSLKSQVEDLKGRKQNDNNDGVKRLKTDLEDARSRLEEQRTKNAELQKTLSQTNSELLEANSKIQSLKSEVKELEGRKQNDNNDEVKRLKTDLEDARSRAKQDKENLQISNKRIVGIEAELKTWKELLAPVKEKTGTNEGISVLREQLRNATERLSKEMNAKVAENETSLENIGIVNRPMNIADEYSLLCSNSWLDAKGCLDESNGFEGHKAAKLLRDMMMISEEVTANVFQNIVSLLIDLTREPISLISDLKSWKNKKMPQKDIPDNLMSEIGDCFRRNADKANLQYLYIEVTKAVEKAMKKDKLDPTALAKEPMKAYVTNLSKLTWKMIIQRPPMKFSTDGEGKKYEGEKTQEIQWGSADPKQKGVVVKYYTHPKLFHGDTIMTKGKVVLG